MKRLQIAIYNIDIGHCKVYSRDFVTYIIWFIEFLNSEFRILNSDTEIRIMDSEFRISKKGCGWKCCFWIFHIRVRSRDRVRGPRGYK